MTSKQRLAQLEKRIDALRERGALARFGPVPIVNLSGWSEGDRAAYDAGCAAGQDAAVTALIERVAGVTLPTLPDWYRPPGGVPPVKVIVIDPSVAERADADPA